jgi:mRNA deadenylase 3'-5' endonuclease subunit Ccr4
MTTMLRRSERTGAWEDRHPILAEGLRTLRPDLIALQEAVVGDGRYQAEDFSGPGYQLVHQISSGAPPMDA